MSSWPLLDFEMKTKALIIGAAALWSCMVWLVTASALPSFCHGLDCPRFTVIDTIDSVELRAYEKAVWVATHVAESDFGLARTIAQERLDRYNAGFNDGDHLVPSTAPIVIEIDVNATGYIMSFFTPFKFQASPPAPSSPDVYIDDRPMREFYVSSFGGYARADTIRNESRALFEKLQRRGIEVDSRRHFFAAYDSPFQTTNRHNEIWFPVENPSALLSMQSTAF